MIHSDNSQINRVLTPLNLTGLELAELEEKAVLSILETTASDGKNYLTEDEIRRLERTVSGFFDYIEGIIERRQSFTMQRFANSLNKFLEFNKYKTLQDHGRISRQQAEAKALEEYEKFNKTQRMESDFDRVAKELGKKSEANE